LTRERGLPRLTREVRMGSLGIGEILLILLIFLILFGAGRLPALANSLGVAVRRFRAEVREGKSGREPGREDR
jgi:TatA/E family protein of Tat protein translocase